MADNRLQTTLDGDGNLADVETASPSSAKESSCQAPRAIRCFLWLSLVVAIEGCALTGTKTILAIDEASGWQSKYGEYIYDGRDLILSIDEIRIKEHGSGIGLILPVIPLDHDRSYEEEELEIVGRVTGFPTASHLGPVSTRISAFSAGQEIQQKRRTVGNSSGTDKEGRRWVQFRVAFSYDLRLGAIEDLTLRFELPMFAETVPELHLITATTSDNQIILTPGP